VIVKVAKMKTQTSDPELPPSCTLGKSKKFYGLLSELLIQEFTEPFYQRLLDLTISEISNAQAGSMMVLQDERYHFVATCGYNLPELKKVTLSLDESFLLAEPCHNSFVLNNF
jgi:hypothetical protein